MFTTFSLTYGNGIYFRKFEYTIKYSGIYLYAEKITKNFEGKEKAYEKKFKVYPNELNKYFIGARSVLHIFLERGCIDIKHTTIPCKLYILGNSTIKGDCFEINTASASQKWCIILLCCVNRLGVKIPKYILHQIIYYGTHVIHKGTGLPWGCQTLF